MQGVGFRRFVERTATTLGLAGWVRNLTDGSVEVLAVGPDAAIVRLREQITAGPRHAAVARVVEQSERAASPEPPPFRLLPDAHPGAPVSPRDVRR